MCLTRAGLGGGDERKVIFFEKNKQKTFACWASRKV
jgi:hypothetical protein